MVYLILEKLSDVLPNPTLEVHTFKWFIAHTECDMVQVRLPAASTKPGSANYDQQTIKALK